MNYFEARPSLSYLLRLWAEEDGGRWVWRISLTPVARQVEETKPLGFSSLETAVAYLQAEMERLAGER
ncbi:MAG TPA: hypothetical protein ENK32_03220 [Anaerolineae bacterium]|nr:hypothetical protein [Anaerolineae bacterium]